MTNRNSIIPVREPELIAAEARKKYHGNDEKVATTSIKTLKVDGVEIISRYCQAHEFELMRAMILALSPRQRALVKSIFCDSKCTYAFSATLHPWDEKLATEIGEQLERIALKQKSGHNGIMVTARDSDMNRSIDIEPNWE